MNKLKAIFTNFYIWITSNYGAGVRVERAPKKGETMQFLEKLMKSHSWNADIDEAITKTALSPDSKYRFKIDSNFKDPVMFVWKADGEITDQCCKVEITDDGNGQADVKIIEMSRPATDKKELVLALMKLLNKEI